MVHRPKPDGGTARLDHNLAVPGDTIAVAVKPDSGKRWIYKRLTSGGVYIPVQDLGCRDMDYRIYTFPVLDGAVYLSVTCHPIGPSSALANRFGVPV